MAILDDILKYLRDLDRQVSALQRLDVNPPLSSTPKYSGTPVAGNVAGWSGPGTVVDAGYGTATVVLTSGDQTIAGIKTFSSEIDGTGGLSVSKAGASTIERTTTGTNALSGAQVLKTTSSNDMVDGFGTGFLYEIRDNAAADNVIGITGAIRNGADNTGVLTGFAYLAGVAKQVYWFDSNFQVFFNGLTSGGANSIGGKAGTSSNDFAVGGVLYVDSGTHSNTTTGETDLATYTVPADTLAVNNQSLEFHAWGTLTNSANTKTIKVKFGTDSWTIMGLTGTPSTWSIRGRIVRTGAATQDVIIECIATSGGTAVTISTATRTLSGSNVLKLTGQGGASTEISQEGFKVWWHDANT